MIVTVANRKGGVGKTTASIFVAHALAAATGGPCALVDADPQASAEQWAQRAAAAGHPLAVPVLAQPTANLVVPETPNVVIDTPPADPDIVDTAIALADVVLIPITASALDLSRVQVTLDAATRRGKPAVVLLTRTRRTLSVTAAEESLRAAGVRVLRTHIPLREALAMAFGQPVRQLHGYDLATAELLGVLPDQPYSVEAVRQRVAPARPAYRKPQPQWTGAGEHRAAPAPSRPRPRPISVNDDEMIQRLKATMARLAK